LPVVAVETTPAIMLSWLKVSEPMMGAAQPESASPTATTAQIRAIAPFITPLNAAYLLSAADEKDALGRPHESKEEGRALRNVIDGEVW